MLKFDENEEKAIKFDNFPLKMMTDLSVPHNIEAIKKQLMRQKLIEYSSIVSSRLQRSLCESKR